MITPRAQLSCSAKVEFAEKIEAMAARHNKSRAAMIRHLLALGYKEARRQERATEAGVEAPDSNFA